MITEVLGFFFLLLLELHFRLIGTYFFLLPQSHLVPLLEV